MTGSATGSMKGKIKGSLDEILSDKAKIAFDRWMERGSSYKYPPSTSESK